MAGSLGSEMLSGGSSLPGRGRRKSSPEAGQLSLTAPTGSCAPHPKRRPVPVPGVLWGTHPHVGRTIRTYRINSFLLAVWELSLLFISWACSLFYVLFLTFPWQQRRKDGAIKRRYMLFSFHNLRGRRAVVRNSHDSSFWKLLTTEASRSPQFCLTGGGGGGQSTAQLEESLAMPEDQEWFFFRGEVTSDTLLTHGPSAVGLHSPKWLRLAVAARPCCHQVLLSPEDQLTCAGSLAPRSDRKGALLPPGMCPQAPAGPAASLGRRSDSPVALPAGWAGRAS